MASPGTKPNTGSSTMADLPGARLTRNEAYVLEALGSGPAPMKAYELLAALKDKGVKAPMTVYRALERLESRGLVHKLDALNAFVICNHDAPHIVQVFLMCTQCSHATEVRDLRGPALDWETLRQLSGTTGFAPDAARIEIRGTCAECRAAP